MLACGGLAFKGGEGAALTVFHNLPLKDTDCAIEEGMLAIHHHNIDKPRELSWASSASAEPGACSSHHHHAWRAHSMSQEETTHHMPAEAKGGEHALEALHQEGGAAFTSHPSLGTGWLGPSKTKWAPRTIADRAMRWEKISCASSDLREPA